MYVEFLEALVTYEKALNDASKGIDEANGLAPYLNFIPVLLEDSLSGFLIDEIGASYSYREATPSEMDWWNSRPWRAAGGRA